MARKIYEEGGLQPEFLTVHMWAHYLIENMTPDCHFIIDGTPRKYDEAHVLDTAFSFYKREKPYVLFMDIDREIVKQRLLARGRADDNATDIEARLNWFETEVTKAVDYFRGSPHYTFVHVDSAKTVAEVTKDIFSATGLSGS
jgi:adenylate kinase